MKTTFILKNIVRITGVIQLITGVVFWTGNAKTMVVAHILLGSILSLALLALTYLAHQAKVSLKLVVIASIWGLVLPIWGLMQEQVFPGTNNWIAQVLHLLSGIGAMGLAEMLASKIIKNSN